MRVLGIDFGTRRFGLAVSDLLGFTAQPLMTLQRTDEAGDLAALARIIEEQSVRRIVIGLPRNMDGKPAEHFPAVEALRDLLRERFGLPVDTFDERLTTLQAERMLIAADASRGKRKQVIDKLAACIILQAWMDANPAIVRQILDGRA